ncbi:MAG: MMPL family transporter [Alphaproteobacteria bacterium]|nr:MMPL family transporter [Alphaproteobacteria bacterium]
MTGIVNWAIERARLTISVLIAVIALGTYAYISIPKEADPDIPIPYFLITVYHQGISPEDAERLIIKPLEVELKTIEGLKELRGIGQQDSALIALEFDVNFDKEQALRRIREKVDNAKSKLPLDRQEPIIQEANVSDYPVLSINLSGEVPERTLFHAAKRLKRVIDQIPGVLSADLSGQREELLEVIIDPAKLETYGVSSDDLYRLVSLNNQLVAAGSLDTGRGRFAVKVPGLFETPDDVLRLPVKVKGDGVVTLRDIAEVRRTFYDPTTYARYNGHPAISVDVKKRTGSNIVETIRLVREAVEKERAAIPPGIHIDYAGDASYWINSQLTQLTNAILLAVALVMILIVASLGLRSGLIVGLSIPTSFLIGFLCLWLGGYTLNMMILFGMVITVGLLVDNAIIVVEYADRKMTEGFSKREAFAEGARRMFWPVVASTATTLAAFAPMLFWPGVPGKFMGYIPLTMIFIMTASMVVALLFLPTVGALVGKPEPVHPATAHAILASETGDLSEIRGFPGLYARMLMWTARHPLFVVFGAVTTLVVVIMIFSKFNKGVEFFVETDADQASIMVRARGNLSIEEKRQLVIEAERRILGTRGVKGVYTIAGASGGGRGGGPVDTIGVIYVELLPYHERGPSKAIMADLRKRLENMPGMFAELREQQSGPSGGKDIQIEIGSDNYPLLDKVVSQVRHAVDTLPGLRDVEDSRPLPGIEWALRIDREQAGRFGANIGTVGAAVQLVTNGIKVGTYRPDDSEDEIDIRVRFPIEDRGIDALDRLRINTSFGVVPITNFVKRVAQQQVNRIERIGGLRVWRIRANVQKDKGFNTSERIGKLKEWIAAQHFNPTVRIKFRGADEEANESGQFLIMAFLAALLAIGAILIIQFNNFWHALVILSAVIFSLIGVFLGILIQQQMFSIIMSGTGFVALMGVMVNHNIVVVDTFHHLLDQGFKPMDAVVRTGVQRLRPIILTTVTAMLGLLPLMYKFDVDFFSREVHFGGPSSDWWVPLATAIIYGMGFSTMISLFVTPAMLAIEHKYWARDRREWGEYGMRDDAESLQPAE